MQWLKRHWFNATLVLFLLLGAWLRLAGLTLKAQVDLVQTDFGRDILIGRQLVLGQTHWAVTPHSSWQALPSSPLHFWLVGVAYVLTGSAEGVYVFYALASLLAIWAAGRFGRLAKSQGLGVVLAGMTALSPVMIGYATLVSQISLLPVLTAMSLWGLVNYDRYQSKTGLFLVILPLWPLALLHTAGLVFSGVVWLVMAKIVWDKHILTGDRSVLLNGFVVWLMSVWIGIVVVNQVSPFTLAQVVWHDFETTTWSHRWLSLAQEIHQLWQLHASVRWQTGLSVLILVVLARFKWPKSPLRWWPWLVASVGLVSLAPLTELGSIHNHYFAPWLPILIWSLVIWAWLFPPNFATRLLRVVVVVWLLWESWVLGQWQPPLPGHTPFAAPETIAQIITADARQTGFDREGFEIWSPVWELTDPAIGDWYSGGWWFLLEQLEGRQLVNILPVSQKMNNVSVKVVGGGVYVICPDDPNVGASASSLVIAKYRVPESVLGNQWLSDQTGMCLRNLWAGLDDPAPEGKTWLLGRVIAPGSKTGGYGVVKYHN